MLTVFICSLLLLAGVDVRASDQEQHEWVAKAETLSDESLESKKRLLEAEAIKIHQEDIEMLNGKHRQGIRGRFR